MGVLVYSIRAFSYVFFFLVLQIVSQLLTAGVSLDISVTGSASTMQFEKYRPFIGIEVTVTKHGN